MFMMMFEFVVQSLGISMKMILIILISGVLLYYKDKVIKLIDKIEKWV